MTAMNLYIWEGEELNGSYGKNGCLIVLAGSLDEAREHLKAYLRDMPQMKVTGPAPSGEAYYKWLREVDRPAVMENQLLLTAYTNEKVLVAPYGLEPPGNFAGRCYIWSWDWLLTAPPTRVVPLRPGILVADYGYEG